MEYPPVLSYLQAGPLLEARSKSAATATTTLDLGLSTVELPLLPEGIPLPGGRVLRWEEVECIAAATPGGRMSGRCFAVEVDGLREVRAYSKSTDLYYSLMPTESAPTMVISGFPMHRVKGTDPHRDTLDKVRTLAPLTGPVLDTATGLGYTAIEAARSAESVLTIERDPTALEIARLNPWSRELFENPRIAQVVGDSFEEVERLGEERFARIVHDPPAASLAGDLYSGEMYRRLYRALRRGGRLYHYIGDPKSRSGARTTTGVIRRLREAGFEQVRARPEAFGLVADKPLR